MATRQLGDPSKKDLQDIKRLASFLIMDSHDEKIIKNILLEVWALGHNQGYEDANFERDSK